jgi:hypothetical protein
MVVYSLATGLAWYMATATVDGIAAFSILRNVCRSMSMLEYILARRPGLGFSSSAFPIAGVPFRAAIMI